MSDINIKYADVQTLVSDYRINLGSLITNLGEIAKHIKNFSSDDWELKGQTADNIKKYYGQVHTIVLSGIIEAAQALLLEAAVYMKGYDDIDGSEDFVFKKTSSETIYNELKLQDLQTDTYHNMVRDTLLDISDIVEMNEPSQSYIHSYIADTMQEISKLDKKVLKHENTTKKNIENVVSELIEPLKSMINSLHNNKRSIGEYNGALPFNQKDVIALYNGFNTVGERIGETAKTAKKVFDKETERIAQEQRNDAYLKMAAAVVIIIVGAALCVASAGTATPLVVSVGGVALGGTTCAFGISDALEAYDEWDLANDGNFNSQPFNPIRDTLFRGNKKVYNITESIVVTSASIAAPVVGSGNLTAGSVAKSSLEYGISGAAGQGAYNLTYNITGDKSIANIANVGASLLAGRRISKKAQTPRIKNVYELNYRTSNGLKLIATKGKTTTVLGSYEEDTKDILMELGNVKTTNFGPRKGGFNLLNTPDELFRNSKQFWKEYNKPWLKKCIERDDIIYLATDPEWESIVRFNKLTGKYSLTGFGKEYLFLRKNNYKFDSVTKRMIK